MQWEFVVALVIAIPIILVPAAFVWYLNIGGICAAIKEAQERKAAQKARIKTAETAQHLAAAVTKAQPLKKKTVGTKH